MSRRQVTIYVNGKEVEASLKVVKKELNAVNRTLSEAKIGSDEYNAAMKRWKELNPIVEDHKKRLSGIESSWKSVTTGATKFLGVAGIAFGAEAVIQYGRELFKTGVGMDTLARKANTVLGDSLGYVESQAAKVAQAMGLTNSEYVAAIANTADLLKPMGFTTEEAARQGVQIQDLAGALSEWSLGKFDAIETTESLRKALLGEREELERYGVSIKQSEINTELAARGMDKFTGNSLKQAEAMVTLELITRKSADAIRGYAENSDSAIRRQAELEAKFKNISETLAVALLPVFEKLASSAEGFIEVVGGVVTFFSDLGDGAKRASDNVQLLQLSFNDEIETLQRGNLSQQNRNQLIDDINTKYRAYLPNLISERDSYEQIAEKQGQANQKFLERITLLAAEEKLKDTSKKRLEIFEQELELQRQLTKAQRDAQANRSADLSQYGQAGTGALLGGLQRVTDLTDAIEANKKAQQEIQDELQQTIDAAAKAGVDVQRVLGSGTGGGGGEDDPTYDTSAAEKQAERELNAQRKKSEQLLEAIAKFKEEERLLTLSENERRLAEVAAKYQDEIDQAIELEKSKDEKVAAAATEQKVELLKLQSEALAAEREKIAEEELSALTDQWLAEQQAQLDSEEQFGETQKEIREELKAVAGELYDAETEDEFAKVQEKYDALLELARTFGIDITAIEDETRKKRQTEEEKLAEKLKAQAEALYQAEKNVQLAKLQFMSTVADQIGAIAGENVAIQEAVFLFQKAAAVAQIVIELQKQLSAIRAQWAITRTQLAFSIAGQALVPGTYAIQAAETTAAKIGAATGIAAVVGSTVAHFAKQKKHGGWASITGADDGQQYNALLIGQRPTGMLDYPHPVLMGSGILANEVGKEYYVSHHDLRKPAVLDHVRAIENITSHRQRATGGFASADPTQNVAAAGATTDPALVQTLQLQNQLLFSLLTEGVRMDVGPDELLAIQRQTAKLNKASGNRL